MVSSLIDIDRSYSPPPDYTEIIAQESPDSANEIDAPLSLSYPVETPTDPESKILTGRRLLKRIARIANTIIKTIAATQKQSKKLETIRHFLVFAKQAIVASKIIKTAFAISHENQEMSWRVKAYNWANMMQSLIVGTITLAPLFNSNFTGGKKIVSACHIIRSGVKLANHSQAPGSPSLTEQEQKNITLLKICKTILSIIGELFVFIGLILGAVLLPKPILLTLGLATIVLGVAKSFYKQTRTPVDEFPAFP